tara:strand:- start:503 stop:784 length:282 start_codon:yes stop_codon:yes gene_type:complete
MSTKFVQVRPNVSDPDFPTVRLDHTKLEYVENINSENALFKFVTEHPELTKLANKKGLSTDFIGLGRHEVFWHEKDWVTENLSSYNVVKRRRR